MAAGDIIEFSEHTFKVILLEGVTAAQSGPWFHVPTSHPKRSFAIIPTNRTDANADTVVPTSNIEIRGMHGTVTPNTATVTGHFIINLGPSPANTSEHNTGLVYDFYKAVSLGVQPAGVSVVLIATKDK